jgi:hypothetical protein
MISIVLPLRTFVTQAMLLLVAIAIEAFILQWNLRFTYRKSVEYSTSINLLSTVLGWLTFFLLEPSFENESRIALMNFLFFDRWPPPTNFIILSSGLVIFFTSFLAKLLGLEGLEWLTNHYNNNPEQADSYDNTAPTSRSTRYMNMHHNLVRGERASAVLLANGLSFSAISVVLLLRLLFY